MKHYFTWMLVGSSLLFPLDGHEMIVSVEGKTMVVDVESQSSVEEMMAGIENELSMPLEGKWVVVEGWGMPSWFQRESQENKYEAYHATSQPRNYEIPLTEQDKKDITFIVTTLADKSLVSILARKGDLNAAGDRINGIHPYRFLGYIFSTEKLKVAARNIRRRGGLVWKNFSSGVTDTLSEESSKGALTKADFDAFIGTIKIDPKLVYPDIVAKNWQNFIENLVKYVERDGDAGRFNM